MWFFAVVAFANPVLVQEVSLLTAASSEADVVAVVKRGASAEVTKTAGGWSHVIVGEVQGWIATQSLSKATFALNESVVAASLNHHGRVVLHWVQSGQILDLGLFDDGFGPATAVKLTLNEDFEEALLTLEVSGGEDVNIGWWRLYLHQSPEGWAAVMSERKLILGPDAVIVNHNKSTGEINVRRQVEANRVISERLVWNGDGFVGID